MQNATFASRRLAETVAEHVAPAFAPTPSAEHSPKVGDKVRLKRPWHVLYRGAYRHYTVDMGRSLLDLPGLPQ